jgi:endonuclease/exonuclease/phosphatase family metal-dependent hydrolase
MKWALMCKQLNEANCDTSHVIIGGDFNHLEEINQRRKAREHFMMRGEAASYHHMMLQYGLVDAWKLDNFRKMSKKEYTFDKSRACLVVSRIDKFIVSQDFDTRGGKSRQLCQHASSQIIPL